MATQAPDNGDTAEMMVLVDAVPAKPVSAAELRWRCDPASLPFASTAELSPLMDVIGQDSAVEALRFGLEIHAPGQNIFVRGLTGTGRMTLVRRLLEDSKPSCPMAKDRCYVHNFAQPDHPRLITLPRGQAVIFARCVDDLVAFIREDLDAALTSPSARAKRHALDNATRHKIDEIVKPFEEALGKADLAIVNVQVGPASQAALLPLIDGKPVPPDDWEERRREGKISDEQATAYQERAAGFQAQLGDVMARVTAVHRKHADEIRAQRSQAVRSGLAEFVESVKARFDVPGVASFLDELVDDLAERRGRSGEPEDGKEDYTRRYRVNVLIGHTPDTACSIIVENVPSVVNLLGTIEHKSEHGGPGPTDHLRVRAGSLLRADGGYLILEARDVLREPGAWKVLVRTLRTGCLELVPSEMGAPWWSPFLKPEPIDVNIKVILLGDAETYYGLDAYDPEFPYLFKVLADFGERIPRNKESVAQYGGVLARIVKEFDLPAFENTAVAALVEHGVRIAGRKSSLTTRFGRLADIAHEAAFLARASGPRDVTGDDVRETIRRTKRRAALPSKRFRELLADGTIRVAVAGDRVGEVNGLAVTRAGPLTYGFPARITATIGPGSVGVINIEREADLSGAVHTKGFYILGGLLRRLLRTEHPLAFHASIAFEQSYGGIDGDSASGAEICCLLSALTNVPLRQDLAMTGAIDQVGHILAVGAINEKIEGFFGTCRDTGLTGTQGVIIPASNAGDLMLRHDVVDACREGQFHVYTVDTVHEALALLTGIRAGERGEDGQYPENTLLGVAVAKAFEYWVKALQGLDTLAIVEEEDAEPDAAS